MPISLTNIRVNNFRSLENIDLTINKTNIIIGQNNCGKSNLLKAINIAFGNVRDISESDIFISSEERISSVNCRMKLNTKTK
ncbi:MAG: AAA family ATPase [Microgenomates group bacterium]